MPKICADRAIMWAVIGLVVWGLVVLPFLYGPPPRFTDRLEQTPPQHQTEPTKTESQHAPTGYTTATPIADKKQSEGQHEGKWYGTFLEHTPDWFVAIFTALLTYVTYRLVKSTNKLWEAGERQIIIAMRAAEAADQSAKAATDQVGISTKSLVSSQRAFVNFKAFEVLHLWDTTATGPKKVIIGWQFTPWWENTGQTPTKKLNIITGIHPGEFPPNFKFEFDKERQLAIIGPKAVAHGESYRIGLPEIFEIKSGKKNIYIWGRVEYSDVFPGTRRHHTVFCHKIVVTGDPTVEEGGIRMVAHSIGNYTDEDDEP